MSQGELFDVGERRPLHITHPIKKRGKRTCTPAPVGTGLEGRQCRHCAHYCRVGWHDKYYPKCGLMKRWWTHGQGSDIRAGWPSCRMFEEKEQ